MRQDPNQSQQLHFTCNDPMHHDLARNLLGNTVLHFTIVTTCTGKSFGGSIRRACVCSLRRWIPLPRPIYGPKGPTMIYPNLPMMISVCGPVGLSHDTVCRPESYGICIIPWQFVVFFRLWFRCCCFETGMLWYVMMSYMLLISVLFAWGSEAGLFPSSLPSLPMETCGDCSLSPHDLSAYMEDAGKVPVWAADLYESFLRFKNLTSQHSLGSQLTNAPFLAGDWWKRMLYSYTLYIYEIVFSVSVH